MSRKRIDFSGNRYGLLSVVALDEQKTAESGRGFWTLLCDCGSTTIKSSSDIGKLTANSSCGCKPKEGKKSELLGKTFGELLVVDHAGSKSGKALWRCLCSCGTETIKNTSSLTRGKLVSCGCVKYNKHGMTGTGAYKSWEAMKARCQNTNSTHYPYYGGRGIGIDPSWEDFTNFFRDMGERPDGTVLDRIDCNGNYTKTNCRWVDRSESSYNTRKQINNTSGKTGVYWSEKDRVWCAVIGYRGEDVRLGNFKSKEEAINARLEAERKYFGYTKE